MALVTYPLNNIKYSAEDAELFHVTRTSGIYANDSFNYSVSGADNTVVIGTGIGWIKNSEFSGKVIALKEATSLKMGLPDSFYPRIDAIIIQFDANRNETNIVVKKGTAASTPVAPSVVQTESIYELHLYHVRREAGSLYITTDNITDLRLNNSYCGLMTDSVTKAVDKTLKLPGVAADASAVGVALEGKAPAGNGNGEPAYVVESGTSGEWKYRIWSDGTKECWMRRTVNFSITGVYGNIYASGNAETIGRISYPFTFSEVPNLTVNTFSSFVWVVGWGDEGLAGSTPTFRMASYAKQSAADYILNYYAIGR